MIQPRRHFLLLMAAALAFCSLGLMWGLPNVADVAQDSVVPLGALAQEGFGFERITAYRYPPFHFQLLHVAFMPARFLVHATSVADNVKWSATFFILSARLVSLLMAMGTVWLLYRTGRMIWGYPAGLAAGLIFLLSPATLYYAKNANLDVPYVFWLALALLLAVRIVQERRAGDYLLLGVASALAVCTKDQAYGFVIGLGIAVAWTTLARPTNEGGAWKRLGVGLAGFILPFALIHNILFHPHGFQRHMQTILGPASEGWREFAAGPLGQMRLLLETLLRFMDVWTLAGVALVGIGLAAAMRADKLRGPATALLLPAICYYLGFMAVVGYVYPRFVMPLMLPASLVAGRGVAWLWERKPGRVAAAAMLAWIALSGLSLDAALAWDERFTAQRWIETDLDPAARIAYVGEMRDMPRFNEPFDALPLAPDEQALAASAPDVVVLSFEQGAAPGAMRTWRASSILRRSLGSWGAVGRADARSHRDDFPARLVRGEIGYRELKRFQSPIAPFVPEVAESANRTIVVVGRR